MRFLVDNALSPALAAILRQHGHEASHVRDHGLQHADDGTIFDAAARQEAVVVSADTDFGTLLALRASTRPSVMLFRGSGSRRAEHLAKTILANLPRLEDVLAAGCIVTFEASSRGTTARACGAPGSGRRGRTPVRHGYFAPR